MPEIFDVFRPVKEEKNAHFALKAGTNDNTSNFAGFAYFFLGTGKSELIFFIKVRAVDRDVPLQST